MSAVGHILHSIVHDILYHLIHKHLVCMYCAGTIYLNGYILLFYPLNILLCH